VTVSVSDSNLQEFNAEFSWKDLRVSTKLWHHQVKQINSQAF